MDKPTSNSVNRVMPDPSQPSQAHHPVLGPLQSAIFRHESRAFQVTLDEEGRLKVLVTGTGNRGMLVRPESNNAVTIIMLDRNSTEPR